ncbi:TioE family transcriptional regulator [Streptomyces fradiae]|uniref:TioE family transcriptional regulator n=1 Tax=Streptomyces fradiae TaxID=1906 RepID=UPI0036C0E565
MGRNLRSGLAGRERLRPVDLARAHSLSTQAVRNYEEAGILPAAERTAAGYRVYTPLHAAALSAFLALVPGHGHGTAAAIMRAVNGGADDEAFRLVDGSHAQLLDDRRTLQAVESALRELERTAGRGAAGSGSGAGASGGGSGAWPEGGSGWGARPGGGPGTGAVPRPGRGTGAGSGPGLNVGPGLSAGPGLNAGPGAGGGSGAAPPSGGGTFIGPLARKLGIRPATLRAWEDAGLVRPPRDPRTGYRVYDEAAVRDARLVHQLRRGGYPLERIAPLLDRVRTAGGLEPLEGTLRDWHARLSARGRALLAGAAELEAYLRARG